MFVYKFNILLATGASAASTNSQASPLIYRIATLATMSSRWGITIGFVFLQGEIALQFFDFSGIVDDICHFPFLQA